MQRSVSIKVRQGKVAVVCTFGGDEMRKEQSVSSVAEKSKQASNQTELSSSFGAVIGNWKLL